MIDLLIHLSLPVLLAVSGALAWRMRAHARTIRTLEIANAALVRREREALDGLVTLRQRLEDATVVDAATGLGNRRTFELVIQREWLRAARAGTCLGLLLIEVDRFRITAEQLGQEEADECLLLVARCISGGLHRALDCPTRYVDAQFAVVMPEGDGFGLMDVAERIRASVEALGMRSRDGTSVTVSIGTAHCTPANAAGANGETPPEQGIQALLGMTALKLYEAKRGGGNCVRGGSEAAVTYNTPRQ